MWQYQAFPHVGFQDEIGQYTTYGIRAENETGEVVVQIQDVTTDRVLAEDIAQRCTRGQLEPSQLRDVIEDLL